MSTTAREISWISGHARQRWNDRVDSTCSSQDAMGAMLEFAAGGRWLRRSRRWWLRQATRDENAMFVVSSQRPGVALVIEDGVVVTVLTRASRRSVERETNTPVVRRRARLVREPRLRPQHLAHLTLNTGL